MQPATPDPTVAALQLTCTLGDTSANLDRAEALLADLPADVDLACLPELFHTGYNLKALGDALFRLAEPIPGPSSERLASLARRLDLALVAGIVERDPHVATLLYDTALVFSRDGQLVGHYRKTHLYPAENDYFAPGHTLPVFQVDGLRIGIAICFEHAFPHIFTTLALRGAQLVFNPSAVPTGFGYLQDLRIPARAQDNQLFVIASNHVGAEGNVTYCGESQIANPRGELLARASSDREEAVVAQLPLDLIWNQRRQEPIFRGLRPELYLPHPAVPATPLGRDSSLRSE